MRAALTVEELVYSRVESKYSPRRIGGLQTVYQSRGLSREDAGFIEQRVGGFSSRDPDLQRLQYFRLPDGRCVIAHTTAIIAAEEEKKLYRDVIDRDGRTGAFVAHCLVVTAEQLSRAMNDPFRLIDAFGNWAEGPADLLERFLQTKEREPIELKVETGPDALDSTANEWPPREFLKLQHLASQAESLVAEGRCLWLRGTSQQAEETLRMLFRSPELEPERRLACTFDTWAESSSPPKTFWALASAKTPAGARDPLEADAAERKVLSAEVSGTEDFMFDYLSVAETRHGVEQVRQFLPTIRWLLKAFEADGPPRDDVGLSEEACQDFVHVFGVRLVTPRLRAAVEGLLTKAIADGLLESLDKRRQAGEVDVLTYVHAALELPERELAEWAFEWIQRERPGLGTADWKCLRVLARKTKHWPLLHWTAALGGWWSRRRRVRGEALEKMSLAQYEAALTLLEDPIAAASFARSRHALRLLQDERLRGWTPRRVLPLAVQALPFLEPDQVEELLLDPRLRRLPPEGLSDRGLVRFVKAVLKAGAGSKLASLATRASKLSGKWARALQAQLRPDTNAAKSFTDAVDDRCEWAAEHPPWWMRLLGRLGLRSARPGAGGSQKN